MRTMAQNELANRLKGFAFNKLGTTSGNVRKEMMERVKDVSFNYSALQGEERCIQPTTHRDLTHSHTAPF